MTKATTNSDGSGADKPLYYDPYDFEIDNNPYPVWRRMRDEKPLYYNEKYDFYALSRYNDVVECARNWQHYSSAKGTLLELIKSGMEIPPGSIIFEDPPDHDIHRNILAQIFSPKTIAELEPKVREFTKNALDPLVGTGGFDFIEHLGSQMPMRTIGMLLGIPEQDQESLRNQIDEGLKLSDDGKPIDPDIHKKLIEGQTQVLAEYIDWRVNNPSDDIMTQLLQAEYDDINGVRRRLTREEVLGFVNLLAAAGNETTARLIGWTGKVLAENPAARKELAGNLALVPRAIEEVLRYEPPSPVQARYVTQDVEHYGQTIKAGSVMLLLNASANRDERRFEDPNTFNIHRKIGQHVTFGYGVHFCMGAALARLEGRVALEEVLKRWPEWEVDWDNAVQAHTSTVRGWEKLPVKTPK